MHTDIAIMNTRYSGYSVVKRVNAAPSSEGGTLYSTDERPQIRCMVSSIR